MATKKILKKQLVKRLRKVGPELRLPRPTQPTKLTKNVDAITS